MSKYSARKGFTSGSMVATGSAKKVEMQEKIAQMQAEMTRQQDTVEATEFTATVGGGVVTAVVNGKKEVLTLTIAPEAVDPNDVEMLQDLVVSAVNEGIRQAAEAMETAMNQATGG
ncbi:MAG: YbaB/EbfC family nucleoid-associated protein, partial [Oscillospiraceae bacterium]